MSQRRLATLPIPQEVAPDLPGRRGPPQDGHLHHETIVQLALTTLNAAQSFKEPPSRITRPRSSEPHAHSKGQHTSLSPSGRETVPPGVKSCESPLPSDRDDADSRANAHANRRCPPGYATRMSDLLRQKGPRKGRGSGHSPSNADVPLGRATKKRLIYRRAGKPNRG